MSQNSLKTTIKFYVYYVCKQEGRGDLPYREQTSWVLMKNAIHIYSGIKIYKWLKHNYTNLP